MLKHPPAIYGEAVQQVAHAAAALGVSVVSLTRDIRRIVWISHVVTRLRHRIDAEDGRTYFLASTLHVPPVGREGLPEVEIYYQASPRRPQLITVLELRFPHWAVTPVRVAA